MTLHVLNAASGTQAFTNCLHQLTEGEPVVLLGDATYAALTGSETLPLLQSAGACLYALHDDVRLRGVAGLIDTCVTIISMSDFVALTEESAVQLSWF
jgi:tRNA 2-thiouridine synthesizing protein B